MKSESPNPMYRELLKKDLAVRGTAIRTDIEE